MLKSLKLLLSSSKSTKLRLLFRENGCVEALLRKSHSNIGDIPSAAVRGMTVLDREKFRITLSVPVLDVCRRRKKQIMPLIKDYRLQRFVHHNIEPSSPATVSLALDPSRVSHFNDLPIGLSDFGVHTNSLRWENHEFNYDNWKVNEIFDAVLPDDQGKFRSFSRIGHLLHVNLKDHLLPYKRLIGEVLLDKFVGVRTVINKTQIIDSTFRNFQFELLAGDADFVVATSENGHAYEFDFARVYWNPRLGTEHNRIARMMEAGDVLYDVFAGVGPFTVPCAKRGVTVLANDLNVEATRWLQHNAKLNKVADRVRVASKDGRTFIREDVKTDLISRWSDGYNLRENNIHITMNLPAMAAEFLDVFNGLYRDFDGRMGGMPIVHVYCFVKETDAEDVVAAKHLVEQHLGHQLDENLIETRSVRSVATNKNMCRISFRLTREVLFGDVK